LIKCVNEGLHFLVSLEQFFVLCILFGYHESWNMWD
jgi:hypothetical protein